MTEKQADNKLISQSFKSVLALLSGNTMATAIGFLIYPLLTRIYTSEDFGVYSIFTSLCGVLTLLANAEYHNAVLLPKEKEDSAACVHLSTISTTMVCAMAGLVSIFVYLFADSSINKIGETILLIAPYIFLCALWNVLNSWYTKNAEFNKIAIFQTTQATSISLFKIIFGYIKIAFCGMSVATVIGQFIALIHNVLSSLPQLKPLRFFDWENCKKNAVRYAKFPLLSLPRSFVNYVSGNLPFFLLPFYFSNDNIGYFSLAIALAFRPINILSTSLYQVFFQKSAQNVNDKQPIMPFFKKFSRTTLSVAIPLLTIIYFITPSLVNILLGDGWEQTSEFIRMMLPWLATSLLVAPICYFTDLFLRQRVGLLIEILHFLARLASLCYGIYVKDFNVAISLYCIANVVMILINYGWLFFIVKKYDNNLKANIEN